MENPHDLHGEASRTGSAGTEPSGVSGSSGASGSSRVAQEPGSATAGPHSDPAATSAAPAPESATATATARSASPEPGVTPGESTATATPAFPPLEELVRLAEERREQVLRAHAELENQRRRFARELESASKYAIERFAAELLNVCDSLELGLAAARQSGQDSGGFYDGMELTQKALLTTFEKFGIEVVDPTGTRFDPERHQAMTTQENAEVPPNTVLTTLQKGYLLQGRVLRPAMVIVSRATQANAGTSA